MFQLHPRLAADTVAIADWPLCRVLMMNDSVWPWLILVPRRADISEIHTLDTHDRATLMEEIARASRQLQRCSGADKINVAALGNVVAQLHVHVIARFRDDPAWPRPVFGVQPATPYGTAELAAQVERLRHALDAQTP